MKIMLCDLLDMEEEIVEDKVVDTGRWTTQHKIIIKIDDKFYRGYYSVGSTEYQDTDYNQKIELIEVHQVEKMVKVWEAVPVDMGNL